MSRSRRLSSALILVFALAGPLSATDYTITVTGDSTITNGNCTLREALLAVGSGAPVDACPAGGASNRIFLPPANYVFDGGEVALNDVNLEIIGQGAVPDEASVNLFGGFSRFLRVDGGSLELRNLRVLFGNVTTAINGQGGCLSVIDADLTLDAAVFSVCNSASTGGGVYFNTSAGSDARLVVRNSDFLGNDASGLGGGGLSADLEGSATASIVGSEFNGNEAVLGSSSVNGGGLRLQAVDTARAEVLDSTFDGNRLTDVTSGSSRAAGLYVSAYGQARVTVLDSAFANNGIDSVSPVGGTLDVYLGAADDAELLFRRNEVADGWDEDELGGQMIRAFASGNSQVVVSDSVVVAAPGNGLSLDADDTGRVHVANVSVVDSGGTGITHNREAGATLEIANSIVWQYGIAAIQSFGEPATLLSNLTGVNPQFVNEPGRDFRLQAASPARDAGTAAASGLGELDIAHAPRIDGSAPDQGAHEYGSLFGDGFESQDPAAWSSSVP